MSFKLKVGQSIDYVIDHVTATNIGLVPYIPNGRILPLDLKRASFYPQTIFDVGANIGQSAQHFTKHFPQAKIYSFEPVAATYVQLVSNTASLKNVSCINRALGNNIEELTINVNASSGSSSILGTVNDNFLRSETIKVTTGHQFCIDHKIGNIDLLKIDTEGFEINVLKGFGPMLKDNIKMIYAEVGFDKTDPYKTHISDLLDLTADKGFIVSNFYEPYRWGFGKLRIGFYNVLLINAPLVGL